jgi:hypothetical protein
LIQKFLEAILDWARHRFGNEVQMKEYLYKESLTVRWPQGVASAPVPAPKNKKLALNNLDQDKVDCDVSMYVWVRELEDGEFQVGVTPRLIQFN